MQTATDPDRFIVRNARASDLDSLYRLAKQVGGLIRLPVNKEALAEIIQQGVASFAANPPLDEGGYIFVLEDTHAKEIIGTSRIDAGFGSERHPYYYFEILDKQHKDQEIKVTINHKVLRLAVDNSVSMLGTLVIDERYRGKKLGKIISFCRVAYIGMFPDRFDARIVAAFQEPLTKDGKSIFWENIGRKFTGLSTKDVEGIFRTKNRRFIKNLFPTGDIYLCTLPPELIPSPDNLNSPAARNIVERLGLRYLSQMHVMGGPIFGANVCDIPIVKNGGHYKVEAAGNEELNRTAFIGAMNDKGYLSGYFNCKVASGVLFLSGSVIDILGVVPGDDVFTYFED